MSTAQAQRKGAVQEAASKPGVGRSLAVLLGHLLSLQTRSAAIWGLLFGIFGVMMVSIFPAMADGPALEELADSYPKGFLEAAGVEDITIMGTIEGFLETQIFGLIVPLVLPFFAILAAARAIAGAEETGTLDVLMGNPLPRWQLVVAYFVTTAVSLAGVLAIFGLFLWGSAQFIDAELTLGATAGGVFGVWPLCVFFGGLAMLCSAIFHRRILAIGVSGAVLFGMYVLDVLGGLVEELEGVRNLSAIYHYGSPMIDGIDWTSFAGLTAAALIFVILAIVAFRRRDIYT